MDQDKAKEPRQADFAAAFFGRLRRMPLRTRLILAFALLIISSASATIFIGNTVFGGKVEELAFDHLALHASLAMQVLETGVERMRRLAQDLALRYPGTGAAPFLEREAGKEIPLDFIILSDPPNSPIWLRFSSETRGSSGGRPAPSIEPARLLGLPEGKLLTILEKADRDGAPLSGIVAPSAAELAPLLGERPDGEQLLLVAVAPSERRGGPSVLVGRVLDGRTEIMTQVQRAFPAGDWGGLTLMVFSGDRCVASGDGGKIVGARAEAGVSGTVLRAGETFTGRARLLERNFHAALVPIRDVSGGVVGMLGIGSSEDVVSDVRKRTTSLFTRLIAGGMVFGFIMTLLFSVWLVSPISQLAEGMSRVAEGDFDYKVRIESADELGTLAHAFNRMVRAVRERDYRLRELTESRLNLVEKQVSIGRLAAGVAHEINNPLTAILTLSSLWLRKMPTDDPKREALEIIVTETSRCREIVRSLLDFAREHPVEKREIDINAVVRESLLLASKYDSMASVKIEPRIAGFPLAVNADAKLLAQVFINLLLNAAEATDPGGVIRVETDEDSSGGFVQVRVVDNGKGIPKEHINRVFEPFFTTKGIGKGTGLGLSVSLGIVQKHEGSIEIESEEGKGTAVTVLLPRALGVRP